MLLLPKQLLNLLSAVEFLHLMTIMHFFHFMAATHTNPMYEDIIQSGRDDFVPANTIVDIMNTLSDPRRPFYFTQLEVAYLRLARYGYESPYSNVFPYT